MIDLNKQFQMKVADSIERVNNSSIVDFFNTAKDALPSVEDQGVQAGIMNNFKKITDSAEARDFITTSNFGPFLPELWPIITAWYPEFPLKDLVSVQDMEQPLSYIITSELLAGTDKADTVMGDKVETPTGLRTIRGRYPTGEIFEERLEGDGILQDGTSIVAALAFYPLLQDSDSLASTQIQVYNSSDVLQATIVPSNVAAGKLNLIDADTQAAAGDIELSTGIMTLTGWATFTGYVLASYVWNIEFANDNNIPTLIEDMKMVPIQAKPQVLAMKWSIFSEYVKKKQFGVDIRTQTTKRVLDLLYHYQVRYILDKLWTGSTGGTQTITWNVSTTIDVGSRIQDLLKQLNTVSHIVQANTGRIEGNVLVVGNNAKALFESLPDIYYKPEAPGKDYGFNGPRKIGSLGRFTVFYDDKLASNAGFMTYRGTEWYDAAAYYGVFLPIAPTDLINIYIHIKQAFVTMTAFRLDKPNAIVKLTFA